MRKIATYLALVWFCHQAALADGTNKITGITSISTNGAPKIFTLVISPCSCPVTGGTVKLNVGDLNLKAGAFLGDYAIKVLPYVFQNEKGKLSITAPDDSMRQLTNGTAVNFAGTATNTKGAVKQIQGTITPSSRDKGKVMLWFMSGKRKIIFKTSYEFQTE